MQIYKKFLDIAKSEKFFTLFHNMENGNFSELYSLVLKNRHCEGA